MINKLRTLLALGILLSTLFLYIQTVPRPIASVFFSDIFSGEEPIVIGKLNINQEFSFSFWVKPAEFNTEWADILDYRHKQDKSFAFHQKADNVNLYAFGVHSKNRAQGAHVNLNPDIWQYVTLIKTTNSLSIYVNGTLIDQKLDEKGIIVDYSGDEILTVGGWGYGGRGWNGEISCFLAFDVPLTIDVITALRLNSPPCKTLEAFMSSRFF